MVDLAVAASASGPRTRAARLAEVAAILGLLALAVSVRVSNLDAYTGSFDEGIRA
jgi:hypothetical protein